MVKQQSKGARNSTELQNACDITEIQNSNKPLLSEDPNPLETMVILQARNNYDVNVLNAIPVHEGTEHEFSVVGYRRNIILTATFALFGVFTGGFLYLLGYWYPIRRLKFTHDKCTLKDASSVVITTLIGKCDYVSKIKTLKSKRSDRHDNNLSAFEKHILSNSELRYFEHMFLRYYISDESDKLISIWGADNCLTFSDLRSANGLSNETAKLKLVIYNENYINIPSKPYWLVFFQLSLDPFYIFQLFSVILWITDDYVLYACLIIAMTLLSLFFNTYQTKKTLQRLRDMIAKETEIQIFQNTNSEIKNNKIITKSSRLVVPGDILIIPVNGLELPCDVVLLNGSCVVNESSLTGESIPTVKTAIDESIPSNECYNSNFHKQHTMFNGTKVIQAKNDGENEFILALVVRTGFYTLKGSLIRSIIFPKPIHFTFFRDSMRFIFCMALIAIAGFIYTVVVFIKYNASSMLILKKALDLFTIIIPPALPATMSVGLLYALRRLRKQDIFCIDPNRVNVCGKIKLVVFDKTGTLTEDHLTVSGVLPVVDGNIGSLLNDPCDLDGSVILKAMATCHSLSIIDNKTSGDPIDMYMFNFVGWSLKEDNFEDLSEDSVIPSKLIPHIKTIVTPSTILSNNVSYSKNSKCLAVLKQFTFDSGLQRMSVIVKDFQENFLTAFSKGSPEKILAMCNECSIPPDINDELKKYTQVGHRVLAVAFKKLPLAFEWDDIKKIQRHEVECNLNFAGIIIFENVVKVGTYETINTLSCANIRSIMATGDNLLTASFIARELHMVLPHQKIIELSIVDGVEVYKEHLIKKSERVEEINSENTKLMINDSYNIWSGQNKLNYVLAVTGSSYEVIHQEHSYLLPKVLVTGVVFARMSPEQKTMLIDDLKDIGYGVCMCGDGANDCGALKAAHAGIALSCAEASIAAPFTSKMFNISCVPSLIMEGRAALATAFGTFKYMALYSFIQFFGMLILYSVKSNYSNNQFLFVDIVLNLPLVFAMTQSNANTKLAIKRPLGRLVHPIFIGCIVAQLILLILVLLSAFFSVRAMNWYRPPSNFSNSGEIEFFSFENTAVIVVSLYEYVWLSLACFKGPPYRAPIYYNYIYGLAFFLAIGLILYVTINPIKLIKNWLTLVDLPGYEFVIGLLGIAFGSLILVLLMERIFDSKSIKLLSDKLRRKKEPRNQYKHVLKELHENSDWPPLI
ncbi:polyamine-transporting ATPase 13A3 isoform X2 [Hydra vulgaris]|uniref:polyamine-transporting ATPase 13A3 isoform X2 n=1 Tax=Hydra vulgaris TaxID=6087 RepID=UPI000641071D|nr:polyamine-transporting ATPase 13A3 isoform X1 [Hydra vulgaris]